VHLDLFSSHRIRATAYFAEPRTKSASLGEAVFRHNQGSDKTLSHSSKIYMCVRTSIRSQLSGVPNREKASEELDLAHWSLHPLSNFVSRDGSA
jgi:hypothetical protein